MPGANGTTSGDMTQRLYFSWVPTVLGWLSFRLDAWGRRAEPNKPGHYTFLYVKKDLNLSDVRVGAPRLRAVLDQAIWRRNPEFRIILFGRYQENADEPLTGEFFLYARRPRREAKWLNLSLYWLMGKLRRLPLRAKRALGSRPHQKPFTADGSAPRSNPLAQDPGNPTPLTRSLENEPETPRPGEEEKLQALLDRYTGLADDQTSADDSDLWSELGCYDLVGWEPVCVHGRYRLARDGALLFTIDGCHFRHAQRVLNQWLTADWWQPKEAPAGTSSPDVPLPDQTPWQSFANLSLAGWAEPDAYRQTQVAFQMECHLKNIFHTDQHHDPGAEHLTRPVVLPESAFQTYAADEEAPHGYQFALANLGKVLQPGRRLLHPVWEDLARTEVARDITSRMIAAKRSTRLATRVHSKGIAAYLRTLVEQVSHLTPAHLDQKGKMTSTQKEPINPLIQPRSEYIEKNSR